MNAKRKGSRKEHRSILLLESVGYACTRSSASLGCWDIIGIGPTDVVLVQVNSRDWPGLIQMEAIRNFKCPPLCKKIVHRYRDRVRLPDVRTV
jgi:Holliday junction resolvase